MSQKQNHNDTNTLDLTNRIRCVIMYLTNGNCLRSLPIEYNQQFLRHVAKIQGSENSKGYSVIKNYRTVKR